MIDRYKQIFQKTILPLSGKHKATLEQKLKLTHFKQWESNWNVITSDSFIFSLDENITLDTSALSARVFNNFSGALESDVMNIITEITDIQKTELTNESSDQSNNSVSEHVYEM